ncbi:tyrosine-type recombinase/integrase [Dactylosporangium sp. NPDC005572]|uniref:tyrosine-type recombinase/integrase n=1 Tax=Dactylosporangium sp. NPDC005572 TaxID=3156889 RepID=UPI0033A34819
MSIDKPMHTRAPRPFNLEYSTVKHAGSVFKRCGCRDTTTGKPLGNTCPKLRRANRSWNPDHGLWAYQLELPATAEGRRRQRRPAGFDTHKAAVDDLDHARQLLDLAGRDRRARTALADLLEAAARARLPLPDLDEVRRRLRTGNPLTGVPTVAEWLPRWLQAHDIDDNTRRTYESHVRVHLIPCLGEVVLDRLRPHHIDELKAWIKARNADIEAAKASTDPDVRATVRGVRPTGPAMISRIRGTLRKAFNDALTKGVISGVPNPAALVKTPNPRPKPMVWEPERVQRWKTTGEVPSKVMVWTDALLAEFLDYAAEHAPDLHPMFQFMAYRGPRRGEACGLLDAEVRLGNSEVSIVNQDTGHGNRRKPPKSEAGNRDVILDPDTVAVLTAYKARRAAWRLAAGPDWPDTGMFFVQPDGHAWNPNTVSQRFRRLIKRAGLPPIRLHDLRHVTATIALDAGIDIKVVSELLGHSTTTLTRDTYQSVVKRLHHEAAGAVAERVKNKRRHHNSPPDQPTGPAHAGWLANA